MLSAENQIKREYLDLRAENLCISISDISAKAPGVAVIWDLFSYTQPNSRPSINDICKLGKTTSGLKHFWKNPFITFR